MKPIVLAASGFGQWVTGVGDVNGDGYDDVIVADYAEGHLFLGGEGGLSVTPAQALDGILFAPAGDLDGDGRDDVIASDPWFDSSTGQVNVYLGSDLGLQSTPATTLDGSAADEMFGSSVSGVGDVDGDGYADIAVGAPGYLGATGISYVYGCSSTGLCTTVLSSWVGEMAEAEMGSAVAGVGDVNGDGYADLLAGSPGYSTDTGRVYLYLGSSTGLGSTAAQQWTGDATQQRLGEALSRAGDVDGDGYADTLFCADPYVLSPSPGPSDRVFLYSGSSAGLSSTPVVEFAEPVRFCAMSAAGDLDGDGYDDLVLGNYDHDTYRGHASAFLGSARGISRTPSWAAAGLEISDQIGISVAGAGDTDGDGYDDLLLGSQVESAFLSRGHAEMRVTSAGSAREGRLSLQIQGALPGDRVLVYAGEQYHQDGACLTELAGLCLGLAGEVLLGETVADEEGHAALRVALPSELQGFSRVILRAVSVREGEAISAERGVRTQLLLGP